MNIEAEIQDIKKQLEINEDIKKKINNTHEAKIQQMGVNTNGSPRYFIYITNAVILKGLKKGDKIRYSINGIDKAELPIPATSREPIQEVTEEKKGEEANEKKNTILSEESDFLVKYRSSTETLKLFIYNNAVKQFGESRVKELLEVKSEVHTDT